MKEKVEEKEKEYLIRKMIRKTFVFRVGYTMKMDDEEVWLERSSGLKSLFLKGIKKVRCVWYLKVI